MRKKLLRLVHHILGHIKRNHLVDSSFVNHFTTIATRANKHATPYKTEKTCSAKSDFRGNRRTVKTDRCVSKKNQAQKKTKNQQVKQHLKQTDQSEQSPFLNPNSSPPAGWGQSSRPPCLSDRCSDDAIACRFRWTWSPGWRQDGGGSAAAPCQRSEPDWTSSLLQKNKNIKFKSLFFRMKRYSNDLIKMLQRIACGRTDENKIHFLRSEGNKHWTHQF